MIPTTIKQHQANVRALRCVITAYPYPTIHHCHGGSMVTSGYNTGMAQRGVGEALIIPLKAGFHVGDLGIDGGVGIETWEMWYGDQMDFLHEVNEQLDYDIFELHDAWKIQAPPRGR